MISLAHVIIDKHSSSLSLKILMQPGFALFLAVCAVTSAVLCLECNSFISLRKFLEYLTQHPCHMFSFYEYIHFDSQNQEVLFAF